MMENKQHLAVYGSLRKGEYNNKYFDLKYVKTTKISGFKLYSLGSYPAITVGDENDSLTVDIMRCNKKTLDSIDRMEFGAGYTEKEIVIDEISMKIYIMNKDLSHRYLVKHGDWSKFLKEKVKSLEKAIV